MAARLSRTLLGRNGRWFLSKGIAGARLCCRGIGSTSSGPGAISTFQDKPRTAEDLPVVGFPELLYRMVFQGFYNRIHELQILEKQKYGHIYRSVQNTVSVNTPRLLEEILRNDEKFPCRGDMKLWTEYRDMRGYGYGPFTTEGERWYNLRAMLNKRMLHPKDSAQYGEVISGVVTDFMKRMNFKRQCSLTGDMVPDMANELYLFSLEGIASILFETRLGCLEENIPVGTHDFIDSIAMMFSNSMAVSMTPKWSRTFLPFWERYIAGWEGIFTFSKELIDKKLEVIQQRLENNQEVEGEYLTYLFSNTKMSTNDVYGSIAELLLAGVDTTSNTLTWTLHLLSKHPDIQGRLFKEVSSLVPPERLPTGEEVTKMPFMRAVVKEALRLYPVVPLNARIISEKSVSIGGYQFPEKTPFLLNHYAISHDEDTFPQPYEFRPERWLRDGRERPNPFGSIPFGFGVRGCVGRRIAELEMYMVLFRIIRQFEVQPDPTMGELKCICRTVLIPDQPLNLHFVDRGYLSSLKRIMNRSRQGFPGDPESGCGR